MYVLFDLKNLKKTDKKERCHSVNLQLAFVTKKLIMYWKLSQHLMKPEGGGSL